MLKRLHARSIVLFFFALLMGCSGSSIEDESLENTSDVSDPTEETPGGVSAESALALAAPLSPVIRSGFESGTVGTPTEAITQFSGVDTSTDAPNDWAALLGINFQSGIGYFEIQYQGGDTTDRYARLSPDPENIDNQTLEFWLQEENVNLGTTDQRGRVQANLYENSNLTHYYQSVRVRLGRDFTALTDQTGTFDWLTLFEAWNGANWIVGEEHPFHVALNLSKPDAEPGSPLHFLAHGRSFVFGVGFDEHWADTNTDFSVPLEKWMTLEMYLQQGDAENGRFYMTAQVEGEDKVVLFDIVDTTQNPNDPEPAGFDYINPIKLYTLESVLEVVNESGGAMVVHWDDLEFGYTGE